MAGVCAVDGHAEEAHLAQKVRGYRAHAAHQTHQKVAHRRARDLAEVGLVPKWLERVALLCTKPVARQAHIHPESTGVVWIEEKGLNLHSGMNCSFLHPKFRRNCLLWGVNWVQKN